MSEQKHKHLDITIDFETCGLGVNAAPMQLAAVAWDRFVPLPSEEELRKPLNSFANPFTSFDHQLSIGIDLRSCFMLGLEFDKHTSDWWQQQPEEVRKEVQSLEPWPLPEAMEQFIQWVKDMTEGYNSYTIWAQGADFDIAKLNHYLAVCGIKAPWKHTQVRCARTYILEHAHMIVPEISPEDVASVPNVIYSHIPKMNANLGGKYADFGSKHNALFDCFQTSWNVWYCYQVERSIFTSL